MDLFGSRLASYLQSIGLGHLTRVK